MTVDEFINQINRLTESVQPGANSAWAFAAERTTTWLKQRLDGTNLANNINYQLEGTLFTIMAPSYLMYQNYGVAGARSTPSGVKADEFSGRSYAYTNKMPPPSVFESSGYNPFASAKTVYTFGLKPKDWFSKDGLTQTYVDYANQFINDNL